MTCAPAPGQLSRRDVGLERTHGNKGGLGRPIIDHDRLDSNGKHVVVVIIVGRGDDGLRGCWRRRDRCRRPGSALSLGLTAIVLLAVLVRVVVGRADLLVVGGRSRLVADPDGFVCGRVLEQVERAVVRLDLSPSTCGADG